MVTKFYTDHGRTDFTEKDVADECGWNTYNDMDNIFEKETGVWMKELVKCYVGAGAMDESVYQALETNIDTKVITDAIQLIKEAQEK